MKANRHCPKCQSRRIGHLQEQPDIDGAGVHDEQPVVREAAVESRRRAVGLSAETIDSGFMAFGRVRVLMGTLEAFVCADCGYHESYVAEPQSVDWEAMRGFRWVNDPMPDGGPYR